MAAVTHVSNRHGFINYCINALNNLIKLDWLCSMLMRFLEFIYQYICKKIYFYYNFNL